MTLDHFLRQEQRPGGNPQGGPAPPLWRYLLPRLSWDRAHVAGAIPGPLLDELARWCGDVRRVDALDGSPQAPTLLVAGPSAPVTAADLRRWVRADDRRAVVALGALAADLARSGRCAVLADAAATPHENLGGDGPGVIVLPPEPRSRKGLIGTGMRVSGRVIARFAPGIGRRLVAAGSTSPDPTRLALAEARDTPASPVTRAVLGAGCGPAAPPGWLVEAADAAGGDLRGARWEVLPARGFRSQKILFRVEPEQGPPVAVKVTQDPGFNARLDNERSVLAALHERRAVDPREVPDVVFHAEVGGLCVVGESAIDGASFRLTAGTRGPAANAVVDLLDGLAVSTGRPAGVDPLVALEELAVRFVAVYAPPPDVRRWVRRQVDALSALGGLPTCAMHGDVGNWNLVVRPDGGVGVFDWENAELDGLPLWDLAYFVQTQASLDRANRSRRFTRGAFARTLLGSSAWSDWLVEDSRRLAGAVGLPHGAAGPLFGLCWVYHAVREAPRLAPNRVSRGRYAGFVRELVGAASSPTLRALDEVGVA